MNGSPAHARRLSRGATAPAPLRRRRWGWWRAVRGYLVPPWDACPLSRRLPTIEGVPCGPPVCGVLTSHGVTDPPGGACDHLASARAFTKLLRASLRTSEQSDRVSCTLFVPSRPLCAPSNVLVSDCSTITCLPAGLLRRSATINQLQAGTHTTCGRLLATRGPAGRGARARGLIGTTRPSPPPGPDHYPQLS